MGFYDELKAAATAGAQGAVRDATGAAVASGETAFQKSTGISVAQPLPPAGPSATSGGSRTASPPSPVSQDALASMGGFQVNKTVLLIGVAALAVLLVLKYRGR